MTEDLLERLEAANPVPPQQVAGAVRDAKARAMFRAIVTDAPASAATQAPAGEDACSDGHRCGRRDIGIVDGAGAVDRERRH